MVCAFVGSCLATKLLAICRLYGKGVCHRPPPKASDKRKSTTNKSVIYAYVMQQLGCTRPCISCTPISNVYVCVCLCVVSRVRVYMALCVCACTCFFVCVSVWRVRVCVCMSINLLEVIKQPFSTFKYIWSALYDWLLVVCIGARHWICNHNNTKRAHLFWRTILCVL